jgi:HPt (histidine-containing phosphotransfer) domain-containing protein
MTANAMQGDREMCLKAGMDDCVSKPVALKALADALAKWLPAETGHKKAGVSEKPDPSPTVADPVQELPIYDNAGMMARLTGDEDLARKVIRAFLEHMPLLIKALSKAIRDGDTAAATLTAHSIKGTSAAVGGEKLRGLAFEMVKKKVLVYSEAFMG